MYCKVLIFCLDLQRKTVLGDRKVLKIEGKYKNIIVII